MGLVQRPDLAGPDDGVVFVVVAVLLVIHELRTPDPVINFRPLANRNFAACSLIIFCVYGILYGASTTLPGLLQTLFGYDAYASGLVLSPSGIGSVTMLLVAGDLAGQGDGRALADPGGPAPDGGGQLLDGLDEPGDQPRLRSSGRGW